MSKVVNLQGLTKKVNRMSTVYYENNYSEIVAKCCGRCGEIKPIDDFTKSSAGLGGRKSTCRGCVSDLCKSNRERISERTRNWKESNKERVKENDRRYYEKNKEKILDYSRSWYDANKEHRLEKSRNWQQNNRDLGVLKTQRYRARKRGLLDTLTHGQYRKTLDYFENACALTGRTVDIEKEHAIPLSIGHDGTTFGNCYPMSTGLNQSKGNRNIFEWFEANRQRFELSQERFDKLIAYLASANAMTVEEYRDYVYGCHANPRSIDELEAN
jgi:hypothetical protein